jgi:hypothetical protein
MHEADMRSLGIADGEVVDIIGDAGDGVERSVYGFRATRYNIPHGSYAIRCFRCGTTPRAAMCQPRNQFQFAFRSIGWLPKGLDSIPLLILTREVSVSLH